MANRYAVYPNYPTGFSPYELPYNEMAAALLSKQKGLDEKKAGVNKIYDILGTIKTIPENITGPGKDSALAQTIINDLTTNIQDLENTDLQSQEGARRYRDVMGKVRNYFGPQGDVTNLLNRYNQFYGHVKNYEDVYKTDPAMRNYATNKLAEGVRNSPLKNEAGFTPVHEGQLYKDVDFKDMSSHFNSVVDNIANEVRSLNPGKYANLDNEGILELWQKGKITEIPYSKVLETISSSVPQDYLYSMYQRRLALGDSPEQAMNELQPTRIVEREIKDKDGKILGKRKEREVNPASVLGNMFHSYSTGKSHRDIDLDYFQVEHAGALERMKKKLNEDLVPITNHAIDMKPLFQEGDLSNFDMSTKGTVTYDENPGARVGMGSGTYKVAGKDTYDFNLNKFTRPQQTIILNIAKNLNNDLFTKLAGGKGLTQEEQAKWNPELKKRLELWTNSTKDNARTVGLTSDEGKAVQYSLFGHNSPEMMNLDKLGTGQAGLEIYDPISNSFDDIEAFKEKIGGDLTKIPVVVNGKLSGDHPIEFMSGNTGKLKAAYPITIQGKTFYIPAPEKFVTALSGNEANAANMSLVTTRYSNDVQQAKYTGANTIVDADIADNTRLTINAFYNDKTGTYTPEIKITQGGQAKDIKLDIPAEYSSSTEFGNDMPKILVEIMKQLKSK